MKIELSKEKVDRIQARFSDAIEETQVENTDNPIFFVRKENAIEMLNALRVEEGLEFNFLSDLTAYDDNPPLEAIPDYGLGTLSNSGGEHRFVVVYQLLSLTTLDRIRLKVRLKEGEAMPTATGLWKAADWLEREVFDMYGVSFAGHPNMRRILLDDRWQGHPQRKDYPMKRYQRFEGSSPLESFGIDKK